MALTTFAKNLMLSALPSQMKVALHSSDPSPDPTANMVTSKMAIVFGTAQNGLIASQDSVIFQIPANSTISHFTIWDSSDRLVLNGELNTPEFYVQAGVYTLNAISIDLNT
ncbi:hypothetical protein Erwinia_phage_Tian_00038 [Erwinia phage Tian]|uniref:Uncharacterized protein n=8 Tax=Caudoviricetes TaxID=2731619 RepID=A0A6B9RIF9_9CAUD|nr:head protein [Erwinia phage phiEa21-4]AXN57370.1 hypothetical protein SUNLIREN_70 [Erwinia phage SunLIRen]AYD79592.1 hypothetical protein LINGLNFE_00084 [Enterobacter phage phi63_307]QEG07699.1 hypothetical protein [Salmonella phage SE5]QGF21781.1 hypothetical protein [Salmonella phage ST-3]QHI00593.1 hypothetical protein [Salmonella phage vB_SenM_SB18]UFD98424.1 hypothetical protein SPARTY_101 [Hafnia phage vB_HalM_SPARTY]UXD79849.1 hypothetical protein 4Roscha1_00042 [Erwinia phage Rosc